MVDPRSVARATKGIFFLVDDYDIADDEFWRKLLYVRYFTHEVI